MTRPAPLIAALAVLACSTAKAAWQPAEPPPDDVIYFVLVDRFANGDPTNDGAVDLADPQAFHGGDLQGVIDHLDELQQLGVRTVWLSPVFQMRTDKFFEWGAFHGYWLEDFTRIEPRFGTADDLRRLSDELHARDMRLVLDVVFNHVAMDAPLTHDRPDWFHPTCDIVDWNDPRQLTDCRVHGLPDLAQENEEVYQFLLGTSLHWIEQVRPDGFRIDAVRHMPNSFLARLAADIAARAGPHFLLLGEDFQGDALSLATTFREGGFGALFDFPLHYAMLDVYCHDRPVGRIAATLSADGQYDDPRRLVPFLDNHDRPRLITECGDSWERARQALTFLLTTRGTPSLTYGTEVGLSGAGEPFNRSDMRFGADSPLAAHIEQVLALRRAHPALQSGRVELLALDEQFGAFARIAPSEAVVVLVNRSELGKAWEIPPELAGAATITDLFSGLPLSGPHIPMPPQQTLPILFVPEQPDGFAQLAAGTVDGSEERAVRVLLRGAAPREGESVVLVGNGPRLANWDPAAGVGPMVATENGLALELTHPVGQVMELKAVLRRPDGSVLWQEGENRYLLVSRGDVPLELVIDW